MSDDVDRATEWQAQSLQAAIETAQSRLQQLPFSGYCYYCSESTAPGKRFCDEYCRDDWEREQAMRRQHPSID